MTSSEQANPKLIEMPQEMQAALAEQAVDASLGGNQQPLIDGVPGMAPASPVAQELPTTAPIPVDPSRVPGFKGTVIRPMAGVSRPAPEAGPDMITEVPKN